MEFLRRWVPVLIWLGTVIPGMSQVLPLRVYQTEDGLASSQVNDILQDRDGCIWFGCTGGVSRFNGLRFDTYRTSDGLPHESCMQLVLQADGQVVAITITGMAVYDPVADRFIPIGPTGEIVSLTEVNNRKYLLLKQKGLFEEVQPGRWRQLPTPGLSQPVALTFDPGGPLVADREHGIWQQSGKAFVLRARIPGIRGLKRIQRNLFAWTDQQVYSGTNIAGLMPLRQTLPAGELIRSLTPSRDGHSLWLGTNTGLFRIQNQSVEKFSEKQGLPGIPVWSTFTDRDGILWFGTNHGVAKLASGDMWVYTRLHNVPTNSAICFFDDPSRNRTLIGTSNGLFSVSTSGKVSMLPYPVFQQYPVWAIVRDRHGTYWVGTEGGGVIQWRGNRLVAHTRETGALPGNNVTDLAIRSDGTLYVACKEGFAVREDGEWRTYTLKNGLPASYVRCLLVTDDGQVRLGTLGAGVLAFDGHAFHRITPDRKQLEAIYDMVEMKGKLWLATNYGIASLGENTLQFFNHENGLVNDSTTALLPVGDHMWVATDGGACLLDTTTGRVIRALTVNDGLPGNEFTTHNALVMDSRSEVWMGVFGGIVRLRRPDIPAQKAPVSPPAIRLREIRYSIRDKDVVLRRFGPRPVTIPYGVRNLVFHVNVIWFRNPETLRAYYQLEGVDDRWVPFLSLRQLQARYPRPPSGTFQFSVRVDSYAAGTSRTEHALVSVSIQRPWWMNPLSWLIALSIAALVAVMGVRFRIRALEAERAKLNRLVREQTRRLEETNAILAHKNLELQQLAETDFLTTLYNRRYFMQTLRYHIQLARRKTPREPLSVILLDLDHFKKINDSLGHAAGDDILKQVADRLRTVCRETDIIARFGGEEFILLLPQTRLEGAKGVAEKIRKAIDQHPFTTEGKELHLTVSGGVAELRHDIPDAATAENLLIRHADINLYRAKSNGRNKVSADLEPLDS